MAEGEKRGRLGGKSNGDVVARTLEEIGSCGNGINHGHFVV